MLKFAARLWDKFLDGLDRLENLRSITWDQAKNAGLLASPTEAGINVTVDNALENSPVFAAVRIISTAVSTLPLCLYRRLPDDGRERASDHDVYNLLHDEPNPETDPMVWWSAFAVQMLMHGNGVAEIERDGAGRPIAMWLLPAERTSLHRDGIGQLFYSVETSKGPIPLLPENVFHVPYFTTDGLWGRGVIDFARECIGLNKAMEKGAASMFANMVRPSGAIEAPPGLSPEARANIRDSIKKQNAGSGKVGRLLFLEDGVKFNPYGISNTDAQWIEGRGFGIQEVARFFSISPTKLGDLGRATWSNIESENLSFIENTLRPVLVPIEQQGRRKLLTKEERKTLFVEAVMEARLRGLTADRYGSYAVAINSGFMLPSEARKFENWKAVPGIDDRPRPGSAPPQPDKPKPPENNNGNQNPDGSTGN